MAAMLEARARGSVARWVVVVVVILVAILGPFVVCEAGVNAWSEALLRRPADPALAASSPGCWRPTWSCRCRRAW
jgi:hypothetical protein